MKQVNNKVHRVKMRNENHLNENLDSVLYHRVFFYLQLATEARTHHVKYRIKWSQLD